MPGRYDDLLMRSAEALLPLLVVLVVVSVTVGVLLWRRFEAGHAPRYRRGRS